ncbi:hypothetical protein AS188_04230 [Kocuria flava]|uniref:LysM domain-containing protein n=1 Tax=Kocuria flava TaxID=446860 RepID=A0A0U3GIA6_9MICC|nr:DUF6448 family protein [Kocuria flava]ALU39091.1 hypothetical protein AS188_04230 [Kocuria flava]GEO90758.1 hypothetical protein KFL01_00640 [Kocuria flava]
MSVLLVLAACLVAAVVVCLRPVRASAHCDTMDGPAAQDGRRALETGNPDHAVKWVDAGHEGELREIFALARTARDQGGAAREVAERWFLENLVRLHRAGEGAPYTGLKPSGAPVGEEVAAADRCIDAGSLEPLTGLVRPEQVPELQDRLAAVLARKGHDVDDLEAGRAYVEAYVRFVKLAEGEEEGHHHASAGHGH